MSTGPNLYINNTRDTNVGLIANYNTGLISNIGLTNVAITSNITGSITPVNDARSTGGLVGFMPTGSVTNSFTTGNIYHTNDALVSAAGGLIGFFGKPSPTISASITNSYNTANVTVVGTAGNTTSIIVGGLSGIFNSDFASGVISVYNSYNAGNITVSIVPNSPQMLVGGVTGYNLRSTLTNVYNTGNVTVTGYTGTKDTFHVAGGIVGYINGSTPNMANTYNSGTVSGYVSGANGFNLGAIAGQNHSTISNSFFDSQTSGVTTAVASGNAAAGTPSKTTAELMTLSTFSGAGWSITATPSTTFNAPANTWFIFAGNTRPILMMENSPNIVNGHNLQMMGAALGGSYQLMNSVDMTGGLTNRSDVWATNYITPTGTGFVPIGYQANVAATFSNTVGTEFTGRFNGNGYSINNLYVNSPTGISTFALFGATAGNATIENVGLYNARVTGTNVTGTLIGNMVGTGTQLVSNAFATGSVTTTLSVLPSYYAIGGLIGAAVPNTTGRFTIQNSYTTASINFTITRNVGGFVGNSQDNISNPGGGKIFYTNNYSSGTFSTRGGLTSGFGYLNTGAVVTNSFWDSGTSGVTTGYNTTTSPTISGLYAGCYAGGGTCATQTITNATLTGSITPKDLSVLSTYTTGGPTWSITSTPSTTSTAPNNTWYVFEGNTRPMLMMENKSAITNPHELQMMGAALGRSYTIENNIDMTNALTNLADVWSTNYTTATGSGFVPVGSTASLFTGSLNGQNYMINQLYINRPNTDWVGVIGRQSGGTISNLSMTNVNVTGRYQVGGMIGGSSGRLTNLSVQSGSVTGSQNLSVVNPDGGGNTIVGGLIGWLYTPASSLTNSYNHATVSGYVMVGGLVGDVHGTVSNSFNTGTVTGPAGAAGVGGLVGYINTGLITSSYNTGNVFINGAASYVGGLLGGNLDVGASVTNSYNSGSVIVGAGSNRIGGLIGSINLAGGVISNSYSSGYVSAPGSTNVGGLIGASAISATNSFWDTQTSGVATSAGGAGVVGKTTQQMFSNAGAEGTTFSNWDTTTVWNILEDQSYPYLRIFYSTTPQFISGTSTAAANSLISIATNGNNIDAINTGANGFFYRLYGYNNISRTTNNVLVAGTALLAYQSGSATIGNNIALVPGSNGSLSGTTGLTIVANTVTAGNLGTSGNLSNTILNQAKGALSDVGILYSVSSNNITITSGNNFVSNAGTTYTLDGNLASSSTISGNGITFNGPVIVSVAAPSLTTTTSGDINLLNTVALGSNILTINTAGSASTATGVISGTGALTKTGTGRLTLSGTNTYSGLTNINGGTLQITNPSGLGTAASGTIVTNSSLQITGDYSIFAGTQALTEAVTLSNGTIIFDGATGAHENYAHFAGGITLAAGTTNTLQTNSLGTNFVSIYTGIITGSGNLVKSGGGQLNIDANNNYSGTTTINNGSLYVLNNNALGATAGNTLVNTGAVLGLWGSISTAEPITLDGGVLYASYSTPAASLVSGNITLLNNPANLIGAESNNPLTISGQITGAGGFIKYHPGTLTLTNTNTYSGITAIYQGAIIIAADAALGAAPVSAIANQLTFNGGTLINTATTTLNSNRGITLGALGGTFQTNSALTFGGVVTGAGALTKTGTNTLILAGNNDYTGSTTISAGTLQIGNSGTTGTLGTGGVTVNGILSFNRSDTFTVADTISGTGSLLQAGTGTTILTANNNYSGGTTISAGTLQLGNNSSTGLITGNIVNNATLAFNRSNDLTFAPVISGSGSVTKSGAGALTLSGNNSYDGLTSINTGILNVDHINALGSTLGGTSVALGTTLNINGVSVGNEALTLNGGLFTGTGVAGFAGAVTVNAESIISNTGGTFTLGGTMNGGSAITLNGTGTTLLNGAVGNVTPLSSLTDNTNLIVNGGLIRTSGDQLYQNAVAFNGDTIFTSTGSGTNNITFNSNITGTNNLSLNGSGAGSYQFTLNGVTANNVDVSTSLTATNSSLSLNSGSAQEYIISGTNSGNINNIPTVSGAFTFTNIQNLTGGNNNDTFKFIGLGTLSGSINGRLGVNTLIGANVGNTWTINANNGGLFSGISGTFANIQNLIGGSGVDDFNFVEGFTVDGPIIGGDATLTSANSIRFDTFSASNMLHLRLGMPVARNIGSRIVNAIDVGAVWDSNNVLITRFEEIQVGYGNNIGKIYFPKEPSIYYKLYDSTGRNGEVGDPFYFYGWNIDPSTLPVAVTALPADLPSPNSIAAQVVQQPSTNAENNNDYSENYNAVTGYDPTVLNKTFKSPLLETTNVSVGAACYKVVN